MLSSRPAEVIGVREGATQPIKFILGRTVDGAFSPQDLTGFGEITLHLTAKRNKANKQLTISGGGLEVTDAYNGEISVIRDAGDFMYIDIEYTGYFRATDPSGKLVDYPEGSRMVFRVENQNT